METRQLGWTGYRVSVIGLGTVELGTSYGLGADAPPSRAEAIALLKRAVEKGITYFDTARSYGVAEEIIGESGIGLQPGVVIGTKCGAFYEQGEDPRGDVLTRRLTEEVAASLKALRRDRLDLLQVHGASAEVIARGELVNLLTDLTKQGKIRYFGVAARGETAPLAAVKSGAFQTIQVAVSILDQRMRDRVLPEAFAAGLGVIARSVFLKGVLTEKRRLLPKHLERLRERSAAIAEFVVPRSLTPEEAALRFTLSVPEVTTLLVGTTSKYHLEAALDHAARGALPAPIMAELSAFRIDDEQLVDPRQWKV